MSTTFSIDDTVFSLFPELQVAVVVARGVTNNGSPTELRLDLDHEQHLARQFFSAQLVGDHPNITAWRSAYRLFGVGSRYRSSVEALARRVAKGGSIPTINPLVDSYNLVSLKYLVPAGGEDLNRVQGGIRLTIATGNESFIALGSDTEDPPEAGEVIYADDQGCLCRRMNWREAERTKLTSTTRNALLVLEGLPPITPLEMKEAAHALHDHIHTYGGGDIQLWLVNRLVPTITFTL